MKSRRAIVGQALVAAIAPMLMGAWVAHTIGAETLRSDAAMIAIPACGYAGTAIFLLAQGKLLSIEMRLRLLLSIVAICAIPGSMLLTAAGSSQVAMPLLALATFASLSLPLAGVCELLRSRAAGRTKDELHDRFDEIVIGFAVLAWNSLVPAGALFIMVEHFSMTTTSQWVGISLILNGCAYLWSCVLGVLGLAAGGITGVFEAISGSYGENSHSAGYKSNARDDVREINPSTGLEMDGVFDSAGYTFGEDPSSRD